MLNEINILLNKITFLLNKINCNSIKLHFIYLTILLFSEKGDSSLVVDLDDQMESAQANINYLHDNILECQQNILQMEEAAGMIDTQAL